MTRWDSDDIKTAVKHKAEIEQCINCRSYRLIIRQSSNDNLDAIRDILGQHMVHAHGFEA